MSDAARTLGAYIPQDRRRALALGRDMPERQQGAALFADLSGFTGLTERLAGRLGPLRGAEELGAWLRRVFDPLVACVEAEGGTVLGYSGDAVTCFFDGDDGAAAVRAADAMQLEVARLREARAADGGRLGVRLKVAVAVGPVRRFTAGDPARRLWDVMAGSTLMRVASMEELAEPDEVLVDGAAARASGREVIAERGDASVLRPAHLVGARDPAPTGGAGSPVVDADDRAGAGEDGGAHGGANAGADGGENGAAVEVVPAGPDGSSGLEVAPTGAEAYEIPTSPSRLDSGPWPDADAAAPWAPAVARDRAAQGEEPLGDFRPAGAVFVAFGGIDWDGDPRAGERLDAFLRYVQRELAAAGGTLVQVTVGDKGSYLYAAFGAPRAHGDDARRAVSWALRIVASHGPEIGDVDGLRAGVTYGPMYTGSYGGVTRLTYGVLGPKTNLAARLMKRAGAGEVLCDPEAARRARRAIRFSAMPEERFKGVAKPVPLHLAVRELDDGERDGGPMFGRDAERIDVGGLLVQLRHGTGGFLRYQGEAGIGKTRLLTWAAEAAALRDVRVVQGRMDDEESEDGYSIWRGPVRELLDLPDGAPIEAVRMALKRRDLHDDEARVAAIASLVAPARDERTRDGLARRETIGRAVVTLVADALREGPLLLVLDDVQRMDERSRDLLGRVAALMREEPLGIVAAHRPVGGEVAELLDAHLPGPPRPLSGLEAETSRMLIAGVLGVPAMAVPYPVATAIHERAGGVPVLVEEIVRDLVERDALRAETSWRGIGRGARGRAPKQGQSRVSFDEVALRNLESGLDALLLARIDRLTSSERTAMKTASVVGRTAEHQPLAHLLERDAAALDAALSPLEGPDMLEALPEAHRFQQTVLHDAAYGNLLFEQRRGLHRQMSAWYLQRLQAGEEVDPERLAYHFFHATEGEDDPALVRPALTALEDLAGRHLAAGAYDEAQEALAKAERLLPEGDDWQGDRARLELRSGEIFETTGRNGDARKRYRAAAEAAERAGDAVQASRAHSGLASLALHRGELDAAREAAERAASFAASSGDVAASARAAVAMAGVAEAGGDLGAAAEHARRAIRTWEHDDDGEDTLRGRIEIARVLLATGAVDEAERLLRSALADAEEAGRPYLEAQATLRLGEAARMRGDLGEAEERFERALDVFEDRSAARDAILAVRRLGELALASGRLVDADRRFADALDAALARRSGRHAVAAAVGRARVAWLRGHHEWALGVFDAARHHRATDRETATVLREALAEASAHGLDAAATSAASVRIEDARDAPTSQATRFGRGSR